MRNISGTFQEAIVQYVLHIAQYDMTEEKSTTRQGQTSTIIFYSVLLPQSNNLTFFRRNLIRHKNGAFRKRSSNRRAEHDNTSKW